MQNLYVLVFLTVSSCLSSVATAQEEDFETVSWSLPDTVFDYLEASSEYAVSTEVNPVYLRLDIDGDQNMEVITLVRNLTASERGWLLCPSKATPSTPGQYAYGQWLEKECRILFSGNPVEHVGTKASGDLGGMDFWKVYEKGKMASFPGLPSPPKPEGEVLEFGKSESWSKFFYWTGEKYVVYQAGD